MDLSLYNNFYLRTEKYDPFKRYNAPIRKAHPISLSEETIKLVAEMAYGRNSEKMMPFYRELALLPFDMCWIEFDYSVLQDYLHSGKALGRYFGDRTTFGEPRKVGFLLDPLTNFKGFRITTVGYMRSPKAGDGYDNDDREMAHMFPMVQNVYTGPGHVQIEPYTRDPVMIASYRKLNDSIVPAICWGVEQDLDWVFENRDVTTQEKWVGSPLYKTNSVELEPSYYDWLRPNANSQNEMVGMLTAGVQEQKGDVRFIVALLALMAHVPVRYVPHRPKGSMLVRGRMRPFFDTNILYINVPEVQRTVKDFDKTLKHEYTESTRRRHHVRNHYRFSDTRHNENWQLRWDVRVARLRWSIEIDGHWRGDARLGIIDHVYGVRTQGEEDSFEHSSAEH